MKEEKSKNTDALFGWLLMLTFLIVGVFFGYWLRRDAYTNGQIDYATGKNIVIEKLTNQKGESKWVEISTE